MEIAFSCLQKVNKTQLSHLSSHNLGRAFWKFPVEFAQPPLPHPLWTYPMSKQGISKRLFPGCVKSGEKVAFCLPSAGRKTQFSATYSHNLGRALLEIPCTRTYYILEVHDTPTHLSGQGPSSLRDCDVVETERGGLVGIQILYLPGIHRALHHQSFSLSYIYISCTRR